MAMLPVDELVPRYERFLTLYEAWQAFENHPLDANDVQPSLTNATAVKEDLAVLTLMFYACHGGFPYTTEGKISLELALHGCGCSVSKQNEIKTAVERIHLGNKRIIINLLDAYKSNLEQHIRPCMQEAFG